MKPIYGMALLAALAAAPLTLEAQTPRTDAGQERGARGQRGAPIAMLLQHRAELGLSAEQVTRLEAIAQRLEQQNAPLVAQLRASGAWQERQQLRERMQQMTPEQRDAMRRQMRERMRDLTPEQREALRQQMRQQREAGEARPRGEGMRTQRQLPEELRPAVQQLTANTRAAMQEARAVLTDEQQVRLRELVQQRRGDRPGTPRAPRGGAGAR